MGEEAGGGLGAPVMVSQQEDTMSLSGLRSAKWLHFQELKKAEVGDGGPAAELLSLSVVHLQCGGISAFQEKNLDFFLFLLQFFAVIVPFFSPAQGQIQIIPLKTFFSQPLKSRGEPRARLLIWWIRMGSEAGPSPPSLSVWMWMM